MLFSRLLRISAWPVWVVEPRVNTGVREECVEVAVGRVVHVVPLYEERDDRFEEGGVDSGVVCEFVVVSLHRP